MSVAVLTSIHFEVPRKGPVRWSPRHDTPGRARRFSALLNAAACHQQPSQGLLAARLITLDGVLMDHLKALCQEETKVYRINQQVAIEWKADNPARTERRYLSALTTQCLVELQGLLRWNELKLMDELRTWVTHKAADVYQTNNADEIRGDQLCYLNDVLQPVLFTHVAEKFVLRALPTTALARLESQQALQMDETMDAHAEGALYSAIQAAETSSGERRSLAIMQAAQDILLQEHPSGIDGWTKRLWAAELNSLIPRLRGTHPANAVTIGWLLHMIVVGTVSSDNPAVSTLRTYGRRLLLPLTNALMALPTEIAEWSAPARLKAYKDVVDAATPSTRPEVGSALSSFQQYLEEHFELPALSISSAQRTTTTDIGRANVIWSHEFERCLLDCGSCEDARLGQMASIALYIANENATRIQDILRIRIAHVALARDARGHYADIEIVRDASLGRLKTIDSQRRLWVRDPRAIALLESWIKLRLYESAPRSALLFGHKSSDTEIYRQSSFLSFLSRCLKNATGDPTIRFHDLRHTAISEQALAIFTSSALYDGNDLEMLAARAGHSSPGTTLHVYTHRYEEALAVHLKVAALDHLDLTCQEAARWLDIKPNTLLQASRRKGISVMHCALNMLEQRLSAPGSSGNDYPVCVTEGFVFSQPSRTATAAAPKTSITPASVADLLMRLSSSASQTDLSGLVGIDGEQLQAWQDQLCVFLRPHLAIVFPRTRVDPRQSDLPALMQTAQLPIHRLLGSSIDLFADAMRQDVDDGVLNDAASSWMSCARGTFISLDRDCNPRGIYQLIKRCRINPLNIAIVTNEHASGTAASPWTGGNVDVALHMAREIYAQELGLQPDVIERSARVGRPRLYLQISSGCASDARSNASSATGLLRAWLFVAKAHLMFKEVTND
jgi:integrase